MKLPSKFAVMLTMVFLSTQASGMFGKNNSKLKNEIVTYPKDCLSKKKNCAVKTYGASYKIELHSSVLNLGPNSSIFIADDRTIELLSGFFVLEVKEPEIKVTSAALTMFPEHGYMLLKRKNNEVAVESLTSFVKLKANFLEKNFVLNPAYSFTFKGIDKLAGYEVDFAKPVNYKSALKKWAKSYMGPKKDFIKHARVFKNHYKRATADIAETYQGIVERKLASQGAANARRLARQRAYAEENKRLINIYKNKNNLNLR